MFSLLYVLCTAVSSVGYGGYTVNNNILVVFSIFISTGDKVCALWYGKGLIRTGLIAMVASFSNR